MQSVIGRRERVVRREDRQTIAAREMDRAAISGRGIAERVPSRHGSVKGDPDGRGRSAATRNCAAAAALTVVVLLPVIETDRCVGRGDRLRPRRCERDGEGGDPLSAAVNV